MKPKHWTLWLIINGAYMQHSVADEHRERCHQMMIDATFTARDKKELESRKDPVLVQFGAAFGNKVSHVVFADKIDAWWWADPEEDKQSKLTDFLLKFLRIETKSEDWRE